MDLIKRIFGAISSFLVHGKASPLTVILLTLVAFFGYRTFNPVPSRVLIITEQVINQPVGVSVPALQNQYVKYTIVCTPPDGNTFCDTAANIFQFIAAAPPPTIVATVSGTPRQLSMRQKGFDSAGRIIWALDLPSAVSGKDSIELVAPIIGTVGPSDLRFESPTIPNLLDGKMSCAPARLSGGGTSQMCVENPTFMERLSAVFKLIRG